LKQEVLSEEEVYELLVGKRARVEERFNHFDKNLFHTDIIVGDKTHQIKTNRPLSFAISPGGTVEFF
jgi:hypothetical protein